MVERSVALVTGGAGGLGRAVGATLQAAGWAVALVGRDEGGLADAREALGGEIRTYLADVTDRGAVAAAVEKTAGDLGPPSALVNAAGIARSASLVPPDDALWARTLEVNVTGAWVASTAVLPHMIEAGGGSIVNVASTAALRGFRYAPAYVASKHALLGLTRAMAEDLVGRGIRVNAVCPGFLETPITARNIEAIVERTRRTPAEARAALAALNASGRLIPPEEVAEIVRELLADETRTGEAIPLE